MIKGLEEVEKKIQMIIAKKQKSRLITARYDFEKIKIKNKVKLLLNEITTKSSQQGFFCRLLFWEGSNHLTALLERIGILLEKYCIYQEYLGKSKPGIVYLQLLGTDIDCMEILLTEHLNYELGVVPSVNIRLQIFIELENWSYLYDIYDDRGMNLITLYNG